jgi:hypothetical protein
MLCVAALVGRADLLSLKYGEDYLSEMMNWNGKSMAMGIALLVRSFLVGKAYTWREYIFSLDRLG